ncbi:hypothetical protein PPERSA_01051 [Pseudocohnilembus persalinus]|uniref:Transaldolase n=1 Tax=Pseudocohnilembus persalinus TaxID=266149 RepID=A0A0V0QVR6_PSEPJ|nr:hypothetical protein PPERSA_01051 [Pseudocohnilembus persalinus]|eukprot:KRX05973.1 hypothetical protein PPERSA_01051 [Pseudocohnilembus persalinus]
MDGQEPSKKVKTDLNALEQLKKYTNIVSDSGDIDKIKQFTPEDATTNPSLILQAAGLPQYKALFDEAITYGKQNFYKKLKEQPKLQKKSSTRSAKKSAQKDEEETQKEPEFNYTELSEEDQNALKSFIVDKLCVIFGKKILEIVPGYVSTEVDARLSYDKQGTIQRAKRVIQLYEEEGISKDRILIKIASTWEGIEAAKSLKTQKIKCNMTLIFGYEQAIACGEAGLFLISPFVGRILDWHKKTFPDKASEFQGHMDPGVISVSQIYNYYKKHDISTVVMGASFRNTGEILALSGCDKLTISPALLGDLQQMSGNDVSQNLKAESAKEQDIPKINVDEKTFRWAQNQDDCMSELLPQGIKKFAADIVKLENLIHEALLANPKNEAEKIQTE